MITALSPSLSVRGAIILAIQNDAALAGVAVYPGKLPNKTTRPFLLIATPTGTPIWRDGTAGGSDLRGVVHVFSGPTDAEPDAEAYAADMNAHVVRILSDLDVVIEDVSVSFVPTLDQVIRDSDEADGWHGIVNYTASAS